MFLIHLKMDNNSSARPYQNIKKAYQKKARERYQYLSEKEKEKKKRQYGCERYINLPEHEKQRL